MDDIEIHVVATEPVTAVDLLAEESGLSKTKIKNAMTAGAVWLGAEKPTRLRRASKTLNSGDKLALYYSEAILSQNFDPPELIDDLHTISIWDKPAGVLSGGTRYGDHTAINRIVEKEFDRPTFLVHRLDRHVWGLMLLAHSKKAAADLSRQFADRTVTKIYRAVVEGTLQEQQTIDEPIDDKPAFSIVTPLKQQDEYSLVDVEIQTGRKHQIRKHLAAIGHPIKGDRQYGNSSSGDLQLASMSIEFMTEDGQMKSYQLDPRRRPKLG